ncbi:MAG: MerR family transcriptional regulator [Firmicutes bacterium]|uniref:DNA-binding transcriptional regulator, MerR family n=1 Tax=Melghirimyces thermohalophilus TaxID=1236220 RepID=A0A1G6M7X2_9BACL|nr:MerR family transcriptional regulator [Melghirimyces thermohalophilus]MDA8353201.1 MerR family transcriptional regulator [Bacillota bacterium]SDC51593.1 DNA-binding transcriptional regulator, MerR family [Melghirimyces thermohalophilus]
MEYTVQKLAQLAGVSSRTLRYYDEIGILNPARINASGYRIYGPAEVDRLQQILFYKELGFRLEQIKQIVTDPGFDRTRALQEHRQQLLAERKRLDVLIHNVEKTIAFMEGKQTMTDKDKFEGFKEQLIEENEKKYGEEIRAKYGDEVVDRSNEKLKNMTQEQFEKFKHLEKEIKTTLAKAFKNGDPASDIAQRAAHLHKQWLTHCWDNYNKEAHAGLAQMYVDDPRFTAYYDEEQPGMAKFLRDAIHIYTGFKR